MDSTVRFQKTQSLSSKDDPSSAWRRRNHVLDGGMGTQLFKHGVPRDEQIWAASALVKEEYHEKVILCHLEYIEAGADVITTNNYAVMPHYYARYFGNDSFSRKIKEHTLLAAKLARKAISISRKDVFLYGCLQPTRESLRPDLTRQYLTDPWNYQTSQIFYRTIVKIMEPYVDGFLLETMNSQLELNCCLQAIKGVTTKPLAVSMQGSFMDPVSRKPVPYMCEHIAQNIIDLVLTEKYNIQMYSLNCAPPEHISNSLQALSKPTKKKLKELGIQIGAYANATKRDVFEDPNQSFSVDGLSSEREATDPFAVDNYGRFAAEWMALGAQCIGGCCKTGPE